MAILSKVCKPDNFESHNSLKLSFQILDAFIRNLIVDLSLNQTNLKLLLYVRQTWMTQMILEISLWGVIFSLSAGYHSLCEASTSFYMRLISRKHCRFLRMFSTGFTLLVVLVLFPLLITSFVFMHSFLFYFTSNIYEVLLINLSANLLSLKTLTFIIRTG